ncbi:MAG: glycoside hydrolase [Victivallales bacterium]|nr:glycoside hydrolase [Victivallales bacterium]
MQRFNDGRDWFLEKRFGLFVHWGLYAVPAWHEQIQWRRTMAKADYVKLVDQFNPTAFDPDQWLDVVEAAGMEYICFTTKHHDGFCMWDTAHTDYNIMHTPYGHDVLAMLAEACHRRGIRLCLYYSCPDWHQPNAINFGGDHQLKEPNPGDQPDLLKYVAFVKSQITELCTNYGQVSAFFWDIPPKIHIPELNATLRELQPGIMINDRGFGPGDYSTPERRVPDGKAFTKPTEACQSVGRQSWGWREDEDYYSDLLLMQSLDNILAMGGNYLLNVGPKPDGTLPAESVRILGRIGDWFGRVREAFYGAEPASHLVAGSEVMLTRKGNRLYLHFPKPLVSTGIMLNPLRIQPERAVLLNDGREVRATVEEVPTFWQSGAYLRVSGLPLNELAGEVPVVRLDFADLDAALAANDGAVGKEYIF